MKTRQQWLEKIGHPENFTYPKQMQLVKRYDCADFDGELYRQSNGIRPDGTVTYQRLFMVFPKALRELLPATHKQPRRAFLYMPQARRIRRK